MEKTNKSLERIKKYRNSKKEGDLSNFVFGKVQPQALPLEEAVLGAIMLDKDAVTSVLDILSPESFYSTAHSLIYKAMLVLFEKSHPIDILTVTDQLTKTGDLETVGGAYAIVELTNRVTSSANVEYHARIVAQKYIQRSLIKSSTKIIQEAYEDTTDVFDLLDKAEQELFAITQQNLSRSFESMAMLASKALKNLEELSQREEGLTGIPTGFVSLDRVTSGFQPSDLIIVAGRPGMGKTSFILSLARNTAVDFGKGIAIFSLEMSNLQLVQRLISLEAEIEGSKLRSGQLEDYEWQQLQSAVEKLSEAPIYIDDTPGINIFELRAKCRRLKKQYDIELVVIDYLQLMTGASENNRSGNREQEISNISRSLKGLAKELNVPVIALAQLSRAVETRGGTKRPQLSDLRECVTGDTLIYLPESGKYTRVDELLGMDDFQVLAMDENYQLQSAKCIDVWETGEKDIFEVTTQSGFKIRTSLNHPFFTVDGWKQLVDIKEGDYVATSRITKSNSKSDLKDEKGYTERSFQAALGMQYCGSSLYKSNLSRQRLHKIAQLLDEQELSSLANSDIKWEKIKSITHVSKEMTYDLHIEQYHNFVANNFIIHNSGAIEQDADIVSFVYRPEYYKMFEDEQGNSLKGVAEIIIAKHRNGSLEDVRLKFTAQFAKFSDIDDNFDDLLGDNNDNPIGNVITRPSSFNDLDDDTPF